ncbi:MAG: glycoside hydrolase family 31 protein [Caloramator sp.]|nr:glycoside hydrolase family 31 protein [Caloramator sp.]
MLNHKETLNVKYEPSYFISNYQKYFLEENTVKVIFSGGKIEITYFEKDIIKIFIGEKDETSIDTNAIHNCLKIIPPTIKEDEKNIIIYGDAVDTLIEKNSLKISFLSKDGKIINQDYNPVGKKDKKIFVSKANDCTAYYGFGEKSGSLNKKGQYMENFNTDDPAHDDNTPLLYKTIPFYIGVKPATMKNNYYYGIYFDNSYRSYFDMGKENRERIFFGAEGGQIQYYFIPGNTIKDVVSKYSILTGVMDMPPLWTLGYQQCRYSYSSRGELENIADTFRKKNIPCDCLYCDIHYMDSFKVMTFDGIKFPAPEDMLKNLHEKGFKVVTILDPGVKIEEEYSTYLNGLKEDCYVKKSDGELYVGEVWAGKSVFPDFSNYKAREWWKKELKDFISLGIDGIWNDMNEPAVFDNEYKTMPEECLHNSNKGTIEHKEFHNLYGMEMSRCSKEAQEELKENIRSFSMTRATFAGGQRYSSIWTGDNQSTWEHLRMSIPMNCNLGISGFSFVGNDVGGFGGNCNEELFIRWMQLGTFLPIFRNHSAIYTRRQEPWSFSKRAEKVAEKAINLRYRFIPYIYNMYYKSYKEGIPVFRPMVMEYPDDINVLDIYSQFMFGDNMLIAPVLYENERQKNVYLPEGIWYNYFTNEKFEGNNFYNIPVALDEILVFIKEGSIIPIFDEHINYIGEKDVPVTLEIFKGKGKILYYEDDGISLNYKRGEYNLYEIKSINAETQNTNINLIYKGLKNKKEFILKYK